mmetsp:Transcript_40693/g.41399  ORF Transcript_40693/g.41399 Transcript_40693/m.41399 type:complete len:93 (-) Transcript_40693:39-317(-)
MSASSIPLPETSQGGKEGTEGPPENSRQQRDGGGSEGCSQLMTSLHSGCNVVAGRKCITLNHSKVQDVNFLGQSVVSDKSANSGISKKIFLM